MSAVDPRLIQARDALDTAALHPVETLPPSVMARELAEQRQVTAGLVGLVDEFPPGSPRAMPSRPRCSPARPGSKRPGDGILHSLRGALTPVSWLASAELPDAYSVAWFPGALGATVR